MVDLLPDALADALGLVVADLRREWRREVELISAEGRAVIAELRAENVALRAEIGAMVAERLATLRDGADGKDGVNGASVTLDDVRPLIISEVGAQFDEVVPPPDPAEVANMIAGEIERRLPNVAQLAAALVSTPEPLPDIGGMIADEMELRAEVAAARAAALVVVPEIPALPDVGCLVDNAVAAAFATVAVPTAPVLPDICAMIDAGIEKAITELPAPDFGPMVNAAVSTAVEALPTAEPGRSITLDDVAPMIREEIARRVAEIDPPKGDPGRSLAPADVADMIAAEVKREVAALPAPKDGAPGKLPIVREWADRVHYEGDVVAHAGGTFQALCDTAREPPCDDWICIAASGADGRDGRSFSVRGTYQPDHEYAALDVVALNGAAFVARRDNPGECPGDGWQLIAAQGKRGPPGDRMPAIKGDPGPPGAPVAAIDIDDVGMLRLTNGDGSVVTCDLYPILSRL